MKIVKINQQNISDINKSNQPFKIIGRINPSYVNGIWTYSEEIYEYSDMKAYPDSAWDYEAYINNPDKTIFLPILILNASDRLF